MKPLDAPPGLPAGLAVRAIDRAEARSRAVEWNELAATQPRSSVFATWEWLDAWWEHLGAECEPWLLAVADGAKLVGLLPLALRRGGLRRDGLRGRILFLCGSEEAGADHLDLLAAPGDAEACAGALGSYLRERAGAWDLLDLAGIDADSALVKLVPRFFPNCALALEPLSIAPFLALPPRFEDYLKGFGAKGRYNLARQVRILEDKGVRYVAVPAAGALPFLDEFFALHARRAQRKGLKSAFAGTKVLAFHRQWLERIANTDQAWLRCLEHEGRMIAGMYCFRRGERLSYYQIAIDPDWERLSPGTSLLYQALREACAAGVREFDFLRGDEEYKRRWTSTSRELVRLQVFGNSARGRLAWLWRASYRLLRGIKRKLSGEAI